MKRLGILAAVAVLIGPPVTGGTAVGGRERVDLRAPKGVKVISYRNAGYELKRSGDKIRIRVDTSPLGTRAPFHLPPMEQEAVDPVQRLARAITAGAETHYAAVSRILGWVSSNIEYRLDRSADQGAEDVLKRRSAYCTGYARLSVALLKASGIPAREVAGIVLEEGPEGGAQYHRWIEVYYPTVGWSFSDPVHSHHYVPATYLRLASSKVHRDAIRIPSLILDRRDGVVAVDIYPYGAGAILGRRNSEEQRASALRITAADFDQASELVAELRGAGENRRMALRGGEGTFIGLGPGTYRLRLTGPGYPGLQGRLQVAAGERRWLQLPTLADGAAKDFQEGK